MISSRRAVAVPLALAAALVGGACSSTQPRPTVTVTVTPSPTQPPTPAAAAAPSGTAAAPSMSPSMSPSTTPSTRAMKALHGTCTTVLPDYSVSQALGRGLPKGTDAFVVGTPDPVISRLGYLNCRYGVTGSGASAMPAIEIGVSLYTTAAKAAERIAATVADYSTHGATTRAETVSGHPARLLSGGQGAEYAAPLLAVAAGQRTVAVTIAAAVATGSGATKDAIALAGLALKQTAA